MLERADRFSVHGEVWLLSQELRAAAHSGGEVADQAQVAAVLGDDDDRFRRVAHHRQEAVHVRVMWIDLARIGRRHGEVHVGKGLHEPGGTGDVVEGAEPTIPRLEVVGP